MGTEGKERWGLCLAGMCTGAPWLVWKAPEGDRYFTFGFSRCMKRTWQVLLPPGDWALPFPCLLRLYCTSALPAARLPHLASVFRFFSFLLAQKLLPTVIPQASSGRRPLAVRCDHCTVCAKLRPLSSSCATGAELWRGHHGVSGAGTGRVHSQDTQVTE